MCHHQFVHSIFRTARRESSICSLITNFLELCPVVESQWGLFIYEIRQMIKLYMRSEEDYHLCVMWCYIFYFLLHTIKAKTHKTCEGRCHSQCSCPMPYFLLSFLYQTHHKYVWKKQETRATQFEAISFQWTLALLNVLYQITAS